VDLTRYQGKWYEVALLPNSFQSMCVADTQAQYTADGDDIRVVNRCRKPMAVSSRPMGLLKSSKGVVIVAAREFFPSFLWKLLGVALDPDYQWVLVGEPGRKYGWVLSRTPVLSQEILNAALDKAVSLGYQRTAFKLSPQTKPLD